MGGDGGDMGSWGGAAEQWGRAVLQEFMEELSRKEDDVHRATKGCGEKLSAELRAAAPRRGAAREHCGGAPHSPHGDPTAVGAHTATPQPAVRAHTATP